MNHDEAVSEAAAAIAASDQSRAGVDELAGHIAAFYSRLALTMSEADALELTGTFLYEVMQSRDD